MSGLIPQAFIDEILQRTDLVELVDSYIPLKKRGNSYIACCPFHNEKSPSFNVVAKKQFYHCFGCGASGNAISFIISYLNQGFVDAIETLATRLGLTIPREGRSEDQNISRDLYQLLATISQFYQQQLKQSPQAVDYLKQRGVNGEIAKRYQLGFASERWHQLEHKFSKNQRELLLSGMLIKNEHEKIYDRYRNRIMFPIHDRLGRIIGFGGRVLDDQQKPKYLNSPETVIFQKNRELYGLHQVLESDKSFDSIIIVEGYLDVIALAQHGINNAVAALGTSPSSFHIQLLSKHTKNIIFCFDGDNAGTQAAWRGLESCLPYLNDGLDVKFMFLPSGQDPDSLVRSEGEAKFRNLISKSTTLATFFMNTLMEKININTTAGKTQLINLCKPFLQKMTEGSYKQLLLDDLSRLTHIDSHRIAQLIGNESNILVNLSKNSLIRNPLRIALALLLQHPDIYAAVESESDSLELNQQEHQILIRLLALLSNNSHATTATLIESWRGTEYFDFINRLAAWDHQVPEQELIKEFKDTLLFLKKQNQELRIRELINKSREQGLNQDERHDLQTMLKKRHTIPSDIKEKLN